MPRFCANLTMLFNEVPLLNRFAEAAKAGFKGVEFLFPYPFPKDQLAERLAANRLKQVLFNLPGGNWEKGERGIGCHPDRTGEFQDGVGKAIGYAKALGCKTVNCLAGVPPRGVSPERARQALVDNLAFAAAALKREDILLVMEPINAYDIPGYLVNRSADGIAILDAAQSDNLKLQYDIYHMQRTEGELTATIEKLLPRIGHIQIADNPGRNEPGTGEINFPFLFAQIDRVGYQGWIGCEYRPKAVTNEGLSWLRAVAGG